MNAPQQNITVAYFNQEVVRFREMFGSREYFSIEGIEQLDAAHEGLAIVYMNLSPDEDPEELEAAETTFSATSKEWQMRKQLMLNSLPMKLKPR